MSGGSDVGQTDLIPCRSCGALTYRALHAGTRKLAPITAAPAADGNIEIWRHGGTLMYRIVKPAERQIGVDYRRSHFADCPNAASHRRGAS